MADDGDVRGGVLAVAVGLPYRAEQALFLVVAQQAAAHAGLLGQVTDPHAAPPLPRSRLDLHIDVTA
ncbi:hypothetical protein Misp01_58970 [Microtetraspora sp. NBRC 13810]|nr:hypothetical protein Misp01_58970 [Microtetraspora sp. NBRC 13810]